MHHDRTPTSPAGNGGGLNRRSLIGTGVTAGLAAFLAAPHISRADDESGEIEALAAAAEPMRRPQLPRRPLDFAAVAPSTADAVVIADGYVAQVLDAVGRSDPARRSGVPLRRRQHRGRAGGAVRHGPRRDALLPVRPPSRSAGDEPRGRRQHDHVRRRAGLDRPADRAPVAERARCADLRDRAERGTWSVAQQQAPAGSPRTRR